MRRLAIPTILTGAALCLLAPLHLVGPAVTAAGVVLALLSL